MSGGSFNYLCHTWEAEDLFSKMDDLQDMASALGKLPYAEDAAAETEELICILNESRVRIKVRLNRLREVWREMEWWKSNDHSEDQLKEALAKYRGNK